MSRRSSHKRAAEEALDVSEEVENDDVQNTGKRTMNSLFSLEPMLKFDPHTAQLDIADKDERNFKDIPVDAQEQCVKAVVRLLFFKGSRRENITRTVVQDELAKLDPAYKKLANIVIAKAQDELYNLWGAGLVHTNDILGCEDSGSKAESYFLTNTLTSTKLNTLLATGNVPTTQGGSRSSSSSSSSSASSALAQEVEFAGDNSVLGQEGPLFGFKLLVFFAILTAPAQSIEFADLLSKLRGEEPRFPESSHSSSRGATSNNDRSAAVPELGNDVKGLLDQMKKEKYVIETKDDADSTNIDKLKYTFGPRFYLDVGKVQLVTAYYKLLGQPVDENVLNNIVQQQEQE
mmetsp:Transcript_6489/g.10924  ORF Transcript_6489/g.10924 Transcript_6489/m.10924 type:complete len:347 (+) Transcript_6489:43-1083(+)|eukprot:CAMPEP_0174960658 /NCGR_PEP_ID=MMETSP0004_2-20121128/3820_1 /TAXON_ID=420556 /ORGANISM="Ochromonas sp., Strain CCMP1393" /LENGTH=346 /DNA_ID=CAMNT_0016209043 /DNA_START=43 /DNA_END=1083 /DNA_ORIENTATION=+